MLYSSSKSLPYVYLCVHKVTKRFYIGYRQSHIKYNRPSHIDFPIYRTSCDKIKNNFLDYDWYIVAEFFNGDDAYDFEQYLIYSHWKDPLLINESCYYQKKRFKSKPLTDEHKSAISVAQSKPKSKSHKKNLSIANTGKHWYNNGVISLQSRECPPSYVPGRIGFCGSGSPRSVSTPIGTFSSVTEAYTALGLTSNVALYYRMRTRPDEYFYL